MASETGKATKWILGVVLIVVCVLVGVTIAYVGDQYHADDEALAAAADQDGPADGVAVTHLPDGKIVFVPQQVRAGMIFYPGAKVQPEAYAPLLTECARQGVLCVLVEPMFNLALLDVDAAEGVKAQFPEVGAWVIAGHSMGGVAAAEYAARHEDDFDGIVFVASYPAADLKSFNGKAVSILAENDGVLNREKYEDAKEKLPADTTEVVIAGGNHASFGNYGEQDGDGQANITRTEQQAQTADAIVELAAEID
ncbi:MAG: alpha/beta hydrolase [Eggerthellaceae bacterium]|nr:alpha/beta hydrolase [Eggerthellaceae bacterium]